MTEKKKSEEKQSSDEAKKDNPASAKATADKEEVKVPKKFQKIVEEIEKMPVIELAELVKILEKKFGVSAAPQVVAQAPGATAVGAGEAAEEKSIFNIELSDVGGKKIDVIKVVRDITQKGLKESKDLVDAAAKAPQMVRENVKKEEAEEIKKKFEAAGAKVELK